MMISYCGALGTLIFVKERLQFEVDRYNTEEKVREMLREMLARLDTLEEKGTASEEEKAFNDGVEFNKTRFSQILDKMAVYVPDFQLQVILKRIDSDGSEMISKDELEGYTKIERNKTLTIAKTCMVSYEVCKHIACCLSALH